MKYRSGFVTNSSSSSFVICKSDLPKDKKDEIVSYIEKNFYHKTISQIIEDIENYDAELYNLIEYNPGDEEMHIWVRRDEGMDDANIDSVLYEYDRSGYNYEKEKYDIKPKFSYHC